MRRLKKFSRYKFKILRKINKKNSTEQRHEEIKIHGYERKIRRIKKPWMKLRISQEVGSGDRRPKFDKEEEIKSRKRTKN